MNFNTVVIIGKLLTMAQPFVNSDHICGLKLEIEVVDRYYKSMDERNKHLTRVTLLIYKKTIQDFILGLKIGDVILFSCKLGNVSYDDNDNESKIGLIISPYLGEAILMERNRGT